jgi:putative ABC transport system permease protein
MLWNFIKGTFRSIAAYKTFTAINILGLAVGITCALIISLYVIHERGYDKFHSGAENIYRVTVSGRLNGIDFHGAMTSGPLSKALIEQIEEVESSTRIVRFGAWLIANDTVKNNEDNILFADSNFFHFFDGFKLIKGDVNTVLSKPKSIVLSKDAAIRYFGSIDIIGKKLTVEANHRTFVVTGIMENPPSNTHIPFDMLGSLTTYKHHVQLWSNNIVYNYVKIKENTDPGIITQKMSRFFHLYILPEFESAFSNSISEDDKYIFNLQSLHDIHLHSHLENELKANSRIEYVYAFAIAAILILIIACLNFMNLSSANSINRSKEVILRKVSGAHKHILVFQFLIESIVFSSIALIISLLLTEIIMPSFNKYLDLNLEYHFFTDLPIVLIILSLTIVFGVISGIYPALFISSFEPVNVLQGKLGEGLKSSTVRSVFVVFQFFISILIITLTMVIYFQVRHMINKDLGFDSDHILVIRRSDALKKNIDSFKNDLLANKDIVAVANSDAIPGRDFVNVPLKLKDFETNKTIIINQIFVNYDFEKTYNLRLTEGRFFNKDIPTDSFGCIINESAAKLMNLSYPVGYQLEQPDMKYSKHKTYKIIGVIKDFHFQSVEKPVEPLVICLMPYNREGFINVKLSSGNISRSIKYIEQTWKSYTSDYPFVYFFMKDDFKKSYDYLIKLGRLFIIFSILAVFVATLGLFGLVAYALNQRTREVGIRKALGASKYSLVAMLSAETIKLISIATLFSWILSYFLSHLWLNSFYYRIQLKPGYFIFAFLLVLFISMFIVIYQSLKTVRKESGVILKYE